MFSVFVSLLCCFSVYWFVNVVCLLVFVLLCMFNTHFMGKGLCGGGDGVEGVGRWRDFYDPCPEG